jgi:predicted TPR repeat methyltransferase
MLRQRDKTQQALDLYNEGKLEQAQALYTELLDVKPNDTELWHVSAIIAARLNQLDKANAAIAKVLALGDHSASVYNSYANILLRQDKLEQAIEAYRHALRRTPHHAVVHNNLANVLVKQGDYLAAQKHYQQALSYQPDYIEAQLNLAKLWLKQQDFTQAEKNFSQVLAIAPDCIVAHEQLAQLYFQQGKFAKAAWHYKLRLEVDTTEAELYNNYGASLMALADYPLALHCFANALALAPTQLMARMNMAACFLQQDRFTEAVYHYEQCLQNQDVPDEVYFNLGVACMAQGKLKQAVSYYQHFLQQMPQSVQGHNNLAACLLRQQEVEGAIRHYQTALQLEPGNVLAGYALSALLKQESPSATPVSYVQGLFDNYAGYFDQHAEGGLGYQVPKLLAQYTLAPEINLKSDLCILDLGCGSGLSGQVFAHRASYLLGVDASAKMLIKARSKACYDALVQADINALPLAAQRFDLIIAADVLVYVGDLAALFIQLRQLLLPEGIFVFSTELATQDKYQLLTTGRFAHNEGYIRELGLEKGFAIQFNNLAPLRMQDDKWLHGMYYVLKRL